MKSLSGNAAEAARIRGVELLGHNGGLKWNQTERGLEVVLPAEKPCDHAYTLKITR